MNEDDFVNKLLTDFQNGTLLMDQSVSVKISDTRKQENQIYDDEDKDHDTIYVHEEIVRHRKNDECGDIDEDTEGEDRLYYESEATQAEDIEEEEKEEEEEYQWMNEEAIRIYVEEGGGDEDGGGYADDDEEEGYGDGDIDVGDDEIVVQEEDGEDEVLDSEEEEREDGEREEKDIIIIQPSRKKQRIDYYLDRLSNLNDDTILHIMSFLSMKDNVKTGILSKRWEYLWTSLSTLVYEHRSMDKGEILKFLDFVNYTLQLCTCENIKKFVLNFLFLSDYTTLVDRAIRSVTLHRAAEDVCLRFHGNDPDKYELAQHFFTNSSLKVLSLFNCIIEPRGKIRWSTIKSLTLEYIELYDDIISKIFKGSPNLEYLKISSCQCYGIGILKIRSENLKELVISFTLDSLIDLGDDTILEIWAPRLKLLSLLGNFYKRRCRLINVASLDKVDLSFKCDNTDMYQENREFLFNLLQTLEHVEDLKLGIWLTELLSTDRQYLFLRLKLSCKTLTLHTTLMSFEGNFPIEFLLLGFPCLETLEINMSCGSNPHTFVEKHGHRFAGTLVLLFPHLKRVRITNFGPADEEYVLRLLKMILENAKELETVAIKSGNLGYSEWSPCLGSQRFIQLSRKILKIPRCSPKAVILI